LCGEAGGVPWDRLGKVFSCGKCKGRFGVRADGVAVELTQTPDGKWVEAPAVREAARNRRKRRVLLAGVALAAVLLPAGVVASWRVVREDPPPAERELPRELDARAELFAQAWLSNDVRLMKRLTSPSFDKAVYAWYNRHRPPAAYRSSTDGVPPDGVRIEVTTQPGRQGHSVARVRVTSSHAPDHPPLEAAWVWEQRGGEWFFLPPR
jgi:hypothetical protein